MLSSGNQYGGNDIAIPGGPAQMWTTKTAKEKVRVFTIEENWMKILTSERYYILNYYKTLSSKMHTSPSYKIQLSRELILCSGKEQPEFYLIDPKTGCILRKYYEKNSLSSNTLISAANFGMYFQTFWLYFNAF